MKILVVNPGSTSTKVAIYENDILIHEENIKHPKEQLNGLKNLSDELPIRKKAIEEFLQKKGYDIFAFDAFAGRGGPLKPLRAGVYKVTKKIVDDINNGNYQTLHSSLLGSLITYDFSQITGKSAFIVDPISTDEMANIARITGHPKIKFAALTHALNVRACARKTAKDLGLDFFNSNFIVAHLGGGISINAVSNGKIIDVLEGRQTGPFSPTSCGVLPVKTVVKLIIKGELKIEEIEDLFSKNGGLTAYFGTDDVKELLERSKSDEYVKEILEAMCFQIAKAINAQKTILKGIYNCIIITGGLAKSEVILDWIKRWLPSNEKYHIIPGEHEMEALALGVLRALNKEEEVLEY
ncbi:MAG: butyrate kinase [Spirochaetales bacterium]|nr:butyrate kinase [Spirochaetales bacterium]